MKVTLPLISDRSSAQSYLDGKIAYCLIQQVRPQHPEFSETADFHCRWNEAEDAIDAGRKAVEFFRSAGYLDARICKIYSSVFDKLVAEFGDYHSYCAQKARTA